MNSAKAKKPLRLIILLTLLTSTFLLFQNFTTLPPNPKSSYFNTNRTEKLIGMFLGMAPQGQLSDLDEVSSFSNTFVIAAGNIPLMQSYLKKNAGRMLPMIEIRSLLQDPKTSLLKPNYIALIHRLAEAIKAVHSGPVLLIADEPLWSVRSQCSVGEAVSCNEVSAHYKNVLNDYLNAGREFRTLIPGSGVYQVEAFMELIRQREAWNEIVMFQDAEYLGFDCYGSVDNCGGHSQTEYGQWVLDYLHKLEAARPIGRKGILTPGAFQTLDIFADQKTTISQLAEFFASFDRYSDVGGMTIFMWNSLEGGGAAGLGAKYLPQVRPYMISQMRKRLKNPPLLSVQPAASIGLVYDAGSYQLGSFKELSIPRGKSVHVYVQSVDMDACLIWSGTSWVPAMSPDKSIWHYEVTNVQSDMTGSLQCQKGQKIYNYQVLLKVQ